MTLDQTFNYDDVLSLYLLKIHITPHACFIIAIYCYIGLITNSIYIHTLYK